MKVRVILVKTKVCNKLKTHGVTENDNWYKGVRRDQFRIIYLNF